MCHSCSPWLQQAGCPAEVRQRLTRCQQRHIHLELRPLHWWSGMWFNFEVQTLRYGICTLCWNSVCVSVCVCVLMHWWGLDLGRECWWGWCWERESCSLFHRQKDRDRCQQDQLLESALWTYIHTHTHAHTHTHSLTAERCVCLAVPHRGRRMKTHKHTLSLCPFVEFQELSETWGLTGTKLSIASHLPVRGDRAEGCRGFDWRPAVDGSSQLHNTWLRRVCVCSLQKSKLCITFTDGKHTEHLCASRKRTTDRHFLLLLSIWKAQTAQSSLSSQPFFVFQWFASLDTPSRLAVTLRCVIRRWPWQR